MALKSGLVAETVSSLLMGLGAVLEDCVWSRGSRYRRVKINFVCIIIQIRSFSILTNHRSLAP